MSEVRRHDRLFKMGSIEDHCLALYARVGQFYRRTLADHGLRDFGFEVLYGPPIPGAEVLFIGYQPSFGGLSVEVARQLGNEAGWRSRCEYASEQWPLAKVMRRMFGEEFLERSMGTNAIFVRARSVEEYMREFRSAHADIRRFCTAEIATLVGLIEPRRIVTIGLGALALFGPSVAEQHSPKGRILTKLGQIAGRPALGVLHLTGARISSSDRDLIAERILAFRS